MTGGPSGRLAAQEILDAGRAVHARLDQIRGPADTVTDIKLLWHTAENAMRALLDGSSLSGQTLVRELRQRNLLTLDQANALAAFSDARERVNAPDYAPTLTDVGYARAGFRRLGDAIAGSGPPPLQPLQPPPLDGPAHQSAGHPPTERQPVVPARKTPWSAVFVGGGVLMVGVAVAVLVVGGLAWLLFGRSSGGYDRDMRIATMAMQNGQMASARNGFERILLDHPKRVEPRVYLARIDRSTGDMAAARKHLVAAIELDPDNALALREMGLLLIAANDLPLAGNFLERAVRAAPNDLASQGYLGCVLLRQGRADLGQRFLERAGPGAWQECAAPTGRRP